VGGRQVRTGDCRFGWKTVAARNRCAISASTSYPLTAMSLSTGFFVVTVIFGLMACAAFAANVWLLCWMRRDNREEEIAMGAIGAVGV